MPKVVWKWAASPPLAADPLIADHSAQSFNRICQVAPMFTANEYTIAWVHFTHYPKQQFGRFCRFCSILPIRYIASPQSPFSPKIAPYLGDLYPHLIHGAFGPPDRHPKRYLHWVSFWKNLRSLPTDRSTEWRGNSTGKMYSRLYTLLCATRPPDGRLHQIFYSYCLWLWRRCDTLRTSGFSDDVDFLHNDPLCILKRRDSNQILLNDNDQQVLCRQLRTHRGQSVPSAIVLI